MEEKLYYYRMDLCGEGNTTFWRAMTAEQAKLIQDVTDPHNGRVTCKDAWSPSFSISNIGIPEKYVDLADKFTSDLKKIYDAAPGSEKAQPHWDLVESPKTTNWESNISLLMDGNMFPHPASIARAFLQDYERLVEFDITVCDGLPLSYEEEKELWQGFYDCWKDIKSLCEEYLKRENLNPKDKETTKAVLNTFNKYEEKFQRVLEDIQLDIDEAKQDMDNPEIEFGN